MVDQIVTRLYFAVEDKRDRSNGNRAPMSSREEIQRFYWQIKPTLERVLGLHMDEEKRAMMLAPTAHHFMELLNCIVSFDPKGALRMAASVAQASRPTGYNLDSLAIREVVKLVETILGGYRYDVRDGQALEHMLVILDIFAEAGWPEALRLVWRLDEIFR